MPAMRVLPIRDIQVPQHDKQCRLTKHRRGGTLHEIPGVLARCLPVEMQAHLQWWHAANW